MSRNKSDSGLTNKRAARESEISLVAVFDLLTCLDQNTKLACIILSIIKHSLPGLIRIAILIHFFRSFRSFFIGPFQSKENLIEERGRPKDIRAENVWELLPLERREKKMDLERHLARISLGKTPSPVLKSNRSVHLLTAKLLSEENPPNKSESTKGSSPPSTLDDRIEMREEAVRFWRKVDELFFNIDKLMRHAIMQNVSFRIDKNDTDKFDYSRDKNVWGKIRRWVNKFETDMPKLILSPVWYDLQFRETEIRNEVSRLYANAKNSSAGRKMRHVVYDHEADTSFGFDVNKKLYEFIASARAEVMMPFCRLFADLMPIEDVLAEPDLAKMVRIHLDQLKDNFDCSKEFWEVLGRNKSNPLSPEIISLHNNMMERLFPRSVGFDLNVSMMGQVLAMKHVFDLAGHEASKRTRTKKGPCLDVQRLFWREIVHSINEKMFSRRLLTLVNLQSTLQLVHKKSGGARKSGLEIDKMVLDNFLHL